MDDLVHDPAAKQAGWTVRGIRLTTPSRSSTRSVDASVTLGYGREHAGVVDADDHDAVLRPAGVVLGGEPVLRMDRDVDEASGLVCVAGELLRVKPEHDPGEEERDEDRDGDAVRVPVADVAAHGR